MEETIIDLVASKTPIDDPKFKEKIQGSSLKLGAESLGCALMVVLCIYCIVMLWGLKDVPTGSKIRITIFGGLATVFLSWLTWHFGSAAYEAKKLNTQVAPVVKVIPTKDTGFTGVGPQS